LADFLLIGGVTVYIDDMDKDEDMPTPTAEGLEALIEASLRDVAAGRTRPMSAFIAELKADFRAAYPEAADRLETPQAKPHLHK
jgi:hypothetical protein